MQQRYRKPIFSSRTIFTSITARELAQLLEMHQHGKLLPRAGLPLLYALNLGIVRVGIGDRNSQDYENGQPARASTAFRLEQNKQLNLTASASYRFKQNGFDKCIFRLKLFMAPPWIILMLVASLLFPKTTNGQKQFSIVNTPREYGIWSILSIKKN